MPEYLPDDRASGPGNLSPVLAHAPRAPMLDSIGIAPEEPLDWRRQMAVVWRHRWWILGAALLGTVGGVVVSRFVPSGYQAQATIWIQSAEPRNGGGGNSARGPIGSNQLFEAYAWVNLLKSYVVLDEVARDLRWYLRPKRGYTAAFASFTVAQDYEPGQYRLVVDGTGRNFTLKRRSGDELQHGAVGDSIGQALGFRWAPSPQALAPGSDVSFTIRPLRDAAKALGEALTVTMDEDGSFLRLALTGDDPARVAGTVNAVAHRYVTVATQLKRVKMTEVAKLLNDQLGSAGEDLHRTERAYETFRVRTITLSPEQGVPAQAQAQSQSKAPGYGDFFALKLEREQSRRDREAIEKVLAQPNGSIEGLTFIGAVQRSPDLSAALTELTTKQAERRALLYGYTNDHPAVQQATDRIEMLQHTTIPNLARALVGELKTREDVLAPQLAVGGRELQEIPQRALEEARLRRDMELAAGLYTSVQQRYDEARLAEASSVADVRILDAAVAPQEPLKDTASRMILLGFAAGLGLGLAGAVVADRVDPRMRYPTQVTRQMGLTIMGVLPHVQDRGAAPGDEDVTQVLEAMRSIRLNLTHAYGSGPIVVTITSPGVGDGKSLVSANLALAYAEAGFRTLLIDGDARRGALHRALRVSRKPGLTDMLAARESLEAVTQKTTWSSLEFIGAGSRFRDSPELLASAAMVELLARVRSRYQVIIVDSPPLGSGVDPYTLGAVTGNVLLVLRSGTTNLEFARSKLGALEYLPIRLLGAIVNDVKPGGGYRYYSYLSGYSTADEGTAVVKHRVRGMI